MAGAALAALSLGAPQAQAETNCDEVASPGAGAVQRLVDSLGRGQTGCLHGGLYTGAVKIERPGITLTRFGDEKATVKGRFWIARGADDVTVERLYLDGSNSGVLPSPTVNANGATFRRNDVTNNHHSICFALGHPEWGRANGTLIELNRIHDCGRLPATNHDHGIYVTGASNTVIRGNWIYDNADRGIQLYPDAQRTTITGNVIDGNGQGIIFSGEGGVASSDNLVEGNVIANSRLRNNVESWYPPGNPVGRNNVVRNNCIRGGAYDEGNGGIGAQRGFKVSGTLRAGPAYVSRRSDDLRVQADSACRAPIGAFRTVVPGPDGVGDARVSRAQRRAKRRAPAVVLGALRGHVVRGHRLPLLGRVAPRRLSPATRVIVVARVSGHRRRLALVNPRGNGTFALRPRVHIAATGRLLRVQAIVRGVGSSHVVRVRLRGRSH
jgi:parallel beta-helix repeat protein